MRSLGFKDSIISVQIGSAIVPIRSFLSNRQVRSSAGPSYSRSIERMPSRGWINLSPSRLSHTLRSCRTPQLDPSRRHGRTHSPVCQLIEDQDLVFKVKIGLHDGDAMQPQRLLRYACNPFFGLNLKRFCSLHPRPIRPCML